MPKLIREFINTIEDEEDRSHIACVYAEEGEDGVWRGSVVFFPVDGGEPLRAKHETTQPNLQDVEYWASGLTYFFLEGALHRAKSPRETAYRELRRPSPEGAPEAGHSRASVVPLTLETVDTGLLGRLFVTRDPVAGARRDLEGGGMLVYDGSRDGEGDAGDHDLSLQFSSRNAAGIAANWLYSKLDGEGVTLRVRGEPVDIRNDAVRTALLRDAHRLGAGAGTDG